MLELYVTASEQNSGKNLITAGLSATMQSLGYSTGVYKPVECGIVQKNGFNQSKDLAFINYCDPNVKTAFTYQFASNSNPLLASFNEKITIDDDLILKDYLNFSSFLECSIIDGGDGLAIPYAKNIVEEDIIRKTNAPLLLVVSPKVASINSILISINHAIASNLNVRGVVICDYTNDTENMDAKLTPNLVEAYSNAKILGTLPTFDNNKEIKPSDLISSILTNIDIEKVFDIKIARLSE